MKRLDVNDEPSMEDILASIRKIIAEDPPRSRAVPPQQHSTKPAAQKPNDGAQSGRGTYFPDLTAPAAEPASPTNATSLSNSQIAFSSAPLPETLEPKPVEPKVEAQPAAPVSHEPSGFPSLKTRSFFPESSPSPSSPSPTERREPSFAAMSRPPEPEASVEDMTNGGASEHLSIDAQLSDLLGSVVPSADGGQKQSIAVDGPAYDFGRSAKAETTEPASQEFGAAFSVTRDGYVPEAGGPQPEERDPFDFDLGPSPFSKKAEETKPAKTEEAEPVPRFDADVPRPSTPAAFAIEDAPTSSDSEETAKVPEAPEPEANEDAANDIEAFSKSAIDRVPSPAQTAPSFARTFPDDFGPPVSRFESPSLETLDPPMGASSASGEDAMPEVNAPPSAEKEPSSTAFKRDVMDFASALREADARHGGVSPSASESFSASTTPAMASLSTAGTSFAGSNGVSSTVASSTTLPVTAAQADQRSMEDTVADLLRPMLRTWLAENMPRIVERALMREINAQLPSDNKTAAE